MNLSCHLHFIRSKHRLCVMLAFLRERALQIFAHYHFDEKHFQPLSKNHRNSRPQLQASSCFPVISCPTSFRLVFFSGCLFHRQKKYVAEARISPILLPTLSLCSADLSGSRRASQPELHAFPASSCFVLVSPCSTYPFSNTLHCLCMIFLATYVSVFSVPHSIFADLFIYVRKCFSGPRRCAFGFLRSSSYVARSGVGICVCVCRVFVCVGWLCV